MCWTNLDVIPHTYIVTHYRGVIHIYWEAQWLNMIFDLILENLKSQVCLTPEMVMVDGSINRIISCVNSWVGYIHNIISDVCLQLSRTHTIYRIISVTFVKICAQTS